MVNSFGTFGNKSAKRGKEIICDILRYPPLINIFVFMAKPEINKKENRELKPVEAPNYKVMEGLFLYTKILMEQAWVDSKENLMQDEERSKIILSNTGVLKNFLANGWTCDMSLNMDAQKEIIAVGMVEHGGHFDQDLIDFVQSISYSRKVFGQICDALNMRMHIKGRFEGETEQLCKEWELANKILLAMPMSTRT